MGMHINKALKMIKKYEGFSPKPYFCPAGVLTIGYGHTGSDVRLGMTITKKQATELLKKDLIRFKKNVLKYDNIYHWNMNQYQALLSFAYNIGSIDQLTDYGRRSIGEIEKAFHKYVKANGVILEGLVKRRNEELKLFRKEVRYD